MAENTIQSIGTSAVAQYAPSQALGESQGLFSAALEAAVAQQAAGEAQGSGTSDTGKDGSVSLANLAPLLLSGLSQGGGETGLMLLLLVLVAGQDGGLLSGTDGLSEIGDLLLGDTESLTDPGSLLGDTESLTDPGALLGDMGSSTDIGSSLLGVGTAAQATMVAAQSLLKAYQNVAQSSQEPAPEATAPNEAVASAKAAGQKTISTDLTSTVGNRSAAQYRAVIDRFDVENNSRYAVNQKGTGDTYCNVFLLDVTSAMGAGIPRHTNQNTGEPSTSRADGAISMNANRISDWLNTYGSQYGWHEVSAQQAQGLANQGCPAVTVWKNQKGVHGHVQVVSPSKDGLYDPSRGVAIAQAGRTLSNYTYIRKIYSSRMSEVQYFAHK